MRFRYLLFPLCWILLVSLQGDPFNYAKKQMIDIQLKGRNITDARVLEVMERVPRHLFVPPEYRSQAYADHPLPIGQGQTISQPYIVALMTQELNLMPHERVLEVGTGSGYQAAVLGELVKEVYTIEIVPELALWAESRLDSLNYKNVHTRHGDGYMGWKEHAPFDAIIITAAAPFIPDPLLEQLKEGGRMVLPLGNRRSYQNLVYISKIKGNIDIRTITEVIFVPMTGKVREKEK